MKAQKSADEETGQHDERPHDPLEQSLSFLAEELGQTNDTVDSVASSIYPFHGLNTIFQLLAASEYQFLNLMDEKTQAFGVDVSHGVNSIQMIKKQVDVHHERLRDVLDIIQSRGGRGWPSPGQQHHPPQPHNGDKGLDAHLLSSARLRSDDAALYLQRTFEKLVRQAKAVSDGCRDEMERLSNESVVREAQRGKEQAEALAKVTFIAAVFVPLSFATSIFGMNLEQLNKSGPDIWVWIAVMVPVMLISIAAWAINGELLKRFWGKLFTRSTDKHLR